MLFSLIQSDNQTGARAREREREKTDWLSSNQIKGTDEEKKNFLPSQILFIHQCLRLAFFFFFVLFHLMTIVDHASDCFQRRACVRASMLSENVTSSVIVVLLFDALQRP